MPADHKVSVGWQIVATFLPIANFWAFYRIRKLRKYMAYAFLPSLVVTVVAAVYHVATPGGRFENVSLEANEPVVSIISGIINWGLTGFAIYLVVRWSREHNGLFDQPTAQEDIGPGWLT